MLVSTEMGDHLLVFSKPPGQLILAICPWEVESVLVMVTATAGINGEFYVTVAPGLLAKVPTPPGKSWILFIENSRTWKVLENHFGPGKISLKVVHFSSGSSGKQAAIV